jgi:hypothetical protein
LTKLKIKLIFDRRILSKLDMQDRNFFNPANCFYETPIANIVLNLGGFNAFPLKGGAKIICSLSVPAIQHCIDFLVSVCNKAGKRSGSNIDLKVRNSCFYSQII